MSKGILVVISGFSGAGKGTLMKQLMATYGDEYGLSISATTRAPRIGETDGKEYFFISKDAFEKMIENGELIEYAQYVGNYYGTPKKYVMDQLEAGKNVILEIEIQGALKVKKQFPDTRLLFVTAPSAKELHDRLVGRGTESPEVIAQRLSRAVEESNGIESYDYLVVNDDITECTNRLHTIITNERNNRIDENKSYTVSSNLEFINQMRKSLQGFSKGE
ncbi:MAG: guanylate kinase [Agathobacter sp.]